MTLPNFFHLRDCFFHEVRGGDAYCSYFKKIGEFECKNCPYLIFKSEAHDRMVRLAEKRAKEFEEELA